jgi:hypothetical protein
MEPEASTLFPEVIPTLPLDTDEVWEEINTLPLLPALESPP